MRLLYAAKSTVSARRRYKKVRRDGYYAVRYLSIPEERVSVLIGDGGSTLDEIQELVDATIHVEGNEVEIDGDPLEERRAYNIVKAIGRGFAPDRALRLLEDNSTLCVIDVTDFASTDNGKERLKGRVIGRNGEAREKIENDTDTEIAVYGKTISILGNVGNVEVARQAVTMLLEGRSHATAFRFLEDNAAKLV